MDKEQLAAMKAEMKGTRHQLAIMVISTVVTFTVTKFTERAYITGLQKWREHKINSLPEE